MVDLVPDSDSPAEPHYPVNEQAVAKTRELIESGAVDPAVTALVGRAEQALKEGPFSVTDKTAPAPSGDPHDYVSMGPYWWPNPETGDGLPYVRYDGQVNPESERTDRATLRRMVSAVAALSRAYGFTKRDEFASYAAFLLRKWFLDSNSRMNPHLIYGQRIPGICEGRDIGIIDTTILAQELIPALWFLQPAPQWPAEERRQLQLWFRDYLSWLLTSEHGIGEASKANNHSVSFDMQVATYALFLGADNLGRQILEGVPGRRIATQIEPDGRQPAELARTRSLSYSTMNYVLFLSLIERGRVVGVDLSTYRSRDGRSIPQAGEWLRPYWTGRRAWEYEQITELPYEGMYTALRQSAWLFGNETLLDDSELVVGFPQTERECSETRLLYPDWR